MLAERDFRYIQDLVHERAAIVLEPGKEYLALTRLDPVARSAGMGSVAELVAALRGTEGSALHELVVDALTTNETTFFRDATAFETMRTVVLPELIARKQRSRTLSIWSAGCSSGQEPYSVAMLLRESFDLEGWQVSILGTEVSAAMLERARAGRYGQLETSRGLPPELRARYFRPVQEGWEIAASIRAMVRFERHNLVEPWPVFAPMDLVLMRNVLLYFDRATRGRVLTQARRVLSPDGYLLLGAAETIANDVDGFERCSVAPTGWYRHEGSALRAAGA